MSYSKRSRYSHSPSPYGKYSRSRSQSMSLRRSRSRESSAENPGNNLYVTGLSALITKRDLEKHFSTEGKVEDVHLVVDPWTGESRGFGFVTMSTVEEADRCIKYLDRSVLECRVITVEKARRRRGRTPTPGRYLGLKTIHDISRSYSPHSRRGSYPTSYNRRRSYSPRYGRARSFSRSRTPYSRSPDHRHDRSYSPYGSTYHSSDDRYYNRSSYRSVSRSISPRARRSYSQSVLTHSKKNLSSGSISSYSRSVSPRHSRRSYSRSVSPDHRRSRKSYSQSISPSPRRRKGSRHKSGVSSRGHGGSASSRSISRCPTPKFASPSS
ncbi:hypothetical protein NMG60_11027741 [Bertholletia excelsa]